MAGTDITTVDFHSATLVAKRGSTPSETLVAMKPVVEGMGLAWQPQHEKLRTHPVLEKTITLIVMDTAQGPREMTALPLTRLNFWLATLHPDRFTDPDVRARVIQYQEECADALFAHFFGRATGTGDGYRAALCLLKKERRAYQERSGFARCTTYRHICERYGIERLGDLTEDQMRDAIAWLRGLAPGRPPVLEAPRRAAGAVPLGMVRLELVVPLDQARAILAIADPSAVSSSGRQTRPH